MHATGKVMDPKLNPSGAAIAAVPLQRWAALQFELSSSVMIDRDGE